MHHLTEYSTGAPYLSQGCQKQNNYFPGTFCFKKHFPILCCFQAKSARPLIKAILRKEREEEREKGKGEKEEGMEKERVIVTFLPQKVWKGHDHLIPVTVKLITQIGISLKGKYL